MTIQEILNSLDVSFLETGHHHCRTGWIQIESCPFCGSSNYHLGVKTSDLRCACWKCGGHHISITLQELGLGRDKAWAFYRGADLEEAIKREKTRVSLKEPAGISPMQEAHQRYIEKRGFNPEIIEKVWGVKGIGIASRLSWRLYLPVTFRGKTVSWTTRTISDKVEQRYISASAEEESINHKSLLYGHDYCRHSVVICEGPTDAWAIGPGAVALFGTAFSNAQVKKLIEFPHRIVCFDASLIAQAKAEDLSNQLSIFPGVTKNVVLEAKDPGSASAKELNLLRKIAKL